MSEDRENSALDVELRALRKGRGATLAKLGASPALLRALDAKDGQEGLVRLQQVLSQLTPSQPLVALKNALAMGKNTGPTLTKRRLDFAQEEEKHPDTIEAWENAGIDELVAFLTAEARPASIRRTSLIAVTAVLTGTRVDFIRELITPVGRRGRQPATRHVTEYINDTPGASPPVLVYQLRPDVGAPPRLNMRVRFRGAVPAAVWGSAHPSMLSVPVNRGRSALRVKDGRVQMVVREPSHGRFYCIAWEW